jgi:hypothetical protein
MNQIKVMIMVLLILSCLTGSIGAQETTISTLPISSNISGSDLDNSIGTGTYEFRSNVDGASVFLDEVTVGVISAGILQVSVPVYDHPVIRQLMIRAQGYTPYNETLVQSPKVGKTLVVRGILQVLPFNLTGTLNLAVSPPGAQVSVDGAPAGVVDQSGILVLRTQKSGYRLIRVTMPGYQDYEEQSYVEANMVTKLRITLIPLTTGTLQITSQPSGAQVNLNRAPYGITPVTAFDIEKGSYVIDFTLPGYQNYQTQVMLSPGQVIPVHAKMEPVPTPAPTPEPTTPEPTPLPTQAGLSPVVCIVSLIAGICLMTLKK